jgi:hypothetical protein
MTIKYLRKIIKKSIENEKHSPKTLSCNFINC